MLGNTTVYDYGFRIYNPSIAKFLSVDPLTAQYPSWSPYPFAMNRVIDGIDLDGLEWRQSTADEVTTFNTSGNTCGPGNVGFVAHTLSGGYYTWVGETQYVQVDGAYGTDQGIGPIFNQQATIDAISFGLNNQTVLNSDGTASRGILQILQEDGSVSMTLGNSHGMVEIPLSGVGYESYNRNDIPTKNETVLSSLFVNSVP